MFFVIDNPNAIPPEILKYKVKNFAARYIASYKLTANDLALELHIRQTKIADFNLKLTCYALVRNFRCLSDGNIVVITFNNKEDTELARLITYGDGALKGSNILRDIFRLEED